MQQLTFTNVHASHDLPRLLTSAKEIAQATHSTLKVYASCIGATRKGEIVFMNKKPYEEIRSLDATKRREFYLFNIDGEDTLVRPDNATFETVVLSFDKE